MRGNPFPFLREYGLFCKAFLKLYRAAVGVYFTFYADRKYRLKFAVAEIIAFNKRQTPFVCKSVKQAVKFLIFGIWVIAYDNALNAFPKPALLYVAYISAYSRRSVKGYVVFKKQNMVYIAVKGKIRITAKQWKIKQVTAYKPAACLFAVYFFCLLYTSDAADEL